ncbi:hypothetical protein Peur_014899 [Populus x canadensis]
MLFTLFNHSIPTYNIRHLARERFLTINLIDRFLERCTVVRKKLKLVGVTAMLLACKYEEVSVPIVDGFVLISDKTYTRVEVLDMRFLKAALSDRKLEPLSFFIIELCLVEYKMLKFPPSLLAAAAIYTAQCSLYWFKQWSKTSEWHTSYTEDQLLECSRMMVSFHQNAGAGKLTGVLRKYIHSILVMQQKLKLPYFSLVFDSAHNIVCQWKELSLHATGNTTTLC